MKEFLNASTTATTTTSGRAMKKMFVMMMMMMMMATTIGMIVSQHGVNGAAPLMSCVFSTEVIEEHVGGPTYQYSIFQVNKTKQTQVGRWQGSNPDGSTTTMFVDGEVPQYTVMIPFMDRIQCTILPMSTRLFCPLMTAESQMVGVIPCPLQTGKKCDVWQFINAKINDTWILESNTSNVVRRIIILPLMGTIVVKTHLYWHTDVPDESHFVVPSTQPCRDLTTETTATTTTTTSDNKKNKNKVEMKKGKMEENEKKHHRPMFNHDSESDVGIVADEESANEMVNSEKVIERINSVAKTWKAGANPVFEGKRFVDVQAMMIWPSSKPKAKIDETMFVKEMMKNKQQQQQQQHELKKIPEEFDGRNEWTKCETIGEVRDQGKCGACWAFASSEALADRLCISSSEHQGESTPLSPEWMVSCFEDNLGCKGGWSDVAWRDLVKVGVVSEKCMKYNGTREECPVVCEDGMTPAKEDVRRASGAYSPYKAWDVEETARMIQEEIMERGSVVVTMWCFSDFPTYKTGVYERTPGTSFIGMHVVKLIGWGSNPVAHWIGVNSWGETWGQNGIFLIKRGTSELGIEEQVIAGIVS